MIDRSAAPARGLDPEAALRRWSAPLQLHRADFFAERMRKPPPGMVYEPAPDPVEMEQKYRVVREVLEGALLEKLKAKELAASGIEKTPFKLKGREVIEPSLWEVLWINYEFQAIVGEGFEFLRAEIFEPGAIPANVVNPPAWLTGGVAVDTDADQGRPAKAAHFQHDADFRHVTLGRYAFALGELQANVVRLLYEASKTDTPWCNGKRILSEAGSTSTHMADLFKSQKHWRRLIESDRLGRYRLVLRRR